MMNLTMTRKTVFLVGPLAAALTIGAVSLPAHAAIALDRTRVIFDGDLKTVSLNISNQNKQLPYLAQGWIEDDRGNKIQSPFTVLPPVQRVEPGKPSGEDPVAAGGASAAAGQGDAVLLQPA